MTWFIRIIPVAQLQTQLLDRNRKIVAKPAAQNHNVLAARCGDKPRRIDAAMVFVICSRCWLCQIYSEGCREQK